MKKRPPGFGTSNNQTNSVIVLRALASTTCCVIQWRLLCGECVVAIGGLVGPLLHLLHQRVIRTAGEESLAYTATLRHATTATIDQNYSSTDVAQNHYKTRQKRQEQKQDDNHSGGHLAIVSSMKSSSDKAIAGICTKKKISALTEL